jgi:hypothetical protein
MALKPDRWEFKTDISFFCSSVTERGVVLVAGTSGSGVSLDQTLATAVLPGTGVTAALKPLGLLLNDMVTFDTNRQHINFLKDEMRVGGKCTLLQQGWVVTNMLATGITPVVGDPAYLAPEGKITNSNTGSPPRVGTFMSGKDEAGYAKVDVSLPN